MADQTRVPSRHTRALREIGRAVRAGALEPERARYYDGVYEYAWAIDPDQRVYRCASGPDGQRLATRYVGMVSR